MGAVKLQVVRHLEVVGRRRSGARRGAERRRGGTPPTAPTPCGGGGWHFGIGRHAPDEADSPQRKTRDIRIAANLAASLGFACFTVVSLAGQATCRSVHDRKLAASVGCGERYIEAPRARAEL
jgi:hypothetical protein